VFIHQNTTIPEDTHSSTAPPAAVPPDPKSSPHTPHCNSLRDKDARPSVSVIWHVREERTMAGRLCSTVHPPRRRNEVTSSPARPFIVGKVLDRSSGYVSYIFFLWWRAPQLMLRTHRSLKAYCATPWWRWAVFYQVLQLMEHRWIEIDRGKPTTRRKTCPSAPLSTTNPSWTWPGIEPGPPRWEAGD
jgi:hypothetical protein